MNKILENTEGKGISLLCFLKCNSQNNSKRENLIIHIYRTGLATSKIRMNYIVFRMLKNTRKVPFGTKVCNRWRVIHFSDCCKNTWTIKNISTQLKFQFFLLFLWSVSAVLKINVGSNFVAFFFFYFYVTLRKEDIMTITKEQN